MKRLYIVFMRGACKLLVHVMMVLVTVSSVTIPVVTSLDDVALNVSGLWDVRFNVAWSSGDTALDNCILSLKQDDTHIFGSCKMDTFQDVLGSVSGISSSDSFDIQTMFYNSPVTSIMFIGTTLQDGLFSGDFIAATSDGTAWRGDFVASMMNSDPDFFGSDISVPSTKGGTSGEASTDEKSQSSQDTNGQTTNAQGSNDDRYFKISYTKDTVYPRPVL